MANIASGGASTATSFVNYSTVIFYHPQKYRAIKPNDLSTLLGFVSRHVNFSFLHTFNDNSLNRLLILSI